MAAEKLDLNNLSGPQKAAIFLLTMGEEFTESFFKTLDQKSINKIGKYISEISYIPAEVIDTVMDEFMMSLQSEIDLSVSGRDFLEQVATKTLDEGTAKEIFKVVGDKSRQVPFRDLLHVPSDNLATILQGEHPQTISLILSYLPHEKAAEIFSLLPDEMKADIALRIVKIGKVNDDVIKELDEALKQDLFKIGTASKKFEGIETLANILNELDGRIEDDVLTYIEEEDEELADRIRQKMFIFEDLVGTEDRNFREILQNVDTSTVGKALKTASEEMKQKVFKNLSERAGEILKEDIDIMGPIRLREVEEAQLSLVKTAKRLEAEGKIVLAGRGKEDILV
jgi:flagellar motor switch protein FliG